jgi:hypothetical protein
MAKLTDVEKWDHNHKHTKEQPIEEAREGLSVGAIVFPPNPPHRMTFQALLGVRFCRLGQRFIIEVRFGCCVTSAVSSTVRNRTRHEGGPFKVGN